MIELFLNSLILGCFEMDVGYDVNSISGTNHEAFSAKECQFKCQEKDSCEIFTFIESEMNCYLRYAKQNKFIQKGVISGPRSCEGMIIQKRDTYFTYIH